jgi:hypothetical protein
MRVGDSRDLLEEYVDQWNKYTILTFSLKKMFDYLDRYYLKSGSERCQSLTDTALSKFREIIFQKRKAEFVNAILQEIHKDRESEIVD